MYGGQLTELPGRSIVVTQWGAGSAVNRAERAAQCALTLRAHLPEVAICVTTGRGLISARVVEGEIIDRGVRLLRRTRPGAIKLDDVTGDMLEARIQVVKEGGAYLLGGDRIEQGVAPRLLGKPSAFLGRSRELLTLEGVLSGCISEPVASPVLVIGAAGTGKSRLRREFLEKVRLLPERGGDHLRMGRLALSGDALRHHRGRHPPGGGHPRRRAAGDQAQEAHAAARPRRSRGTSPRSWAS